MKHTLRKLKNRIISGLTVLILVLTPMMSPIAVSASGADFGAAKEVVAATPLGDLPEQDSSASENDSSWEDGSYTPENESTAPEEECSETEKDSSSAEEKDSSIVPEQESTVPEKDSVSPEKDSTSPKPDFRESGIENENGDSLYPVLSDTTENAELSIYSSAEDSDVEVTPVQVNTKEEGLEVVKGYVFEGKEDPEMLNAGPDDAGLNEGLEDTKDAHSEEDSEENRPDEEENNSEEDSSEKESSSEKNSENGENTEENETLYVKAETADNVTLSPREKMSLYSVEDGRLKDVIIEDISEDNGLCEIDGDVAGIALVKDTGYRHLNLEVYPDSENLEKKITLDGMMPKNANATVIEVEGSIPKQDQDAGENVSSEDTSNEDSSNEENTENEENDNRGVTLVAYDITISDENGEYQPGEDRPIEVTIKDDRISTGLLLSLWHIKDDGSREEITDFTVEDGQIRFSATGFSAYEIIEGPEPYSTEIKYAMQLSDFTSNEEGKDASRGFYLFYTSGSDKYFTNKVNDTGAFNETNSLLGAAVWYFEEIEENGDKLTCLMSTIENGEKKYLKRVTDDVSVALADKEDATRIEISTSSKNNGYFYYKHNSVDLYLQHSGSGKGIRFYGNKQNTDNCSIKAVFVSSIKPPKDPYGFDGKTYGLMYNQNSAVGSALMGEYKGSSTSILNAQNLIVRKNTVDRTEMLYVAVDSNISMWTFHSMEEDKYTLSTEVNGTVKYLKMTSDSLSLTDSESEATAFKLTPDGGKIILSDNGYAITFNNNGFKPAKATSDSTQKLNLVELSKLTEEDFVIYSANKIGVSEKDANGEYIVPDGAQVIVYTRIWDESTKTYNFYAIDSDGSLVPCYERGDDIMWVGSKINTLLWNFTEYHNDDGTPNFYYELQNAYSEKYLAPQIKDGQVLSDETIGINMPGRRDGQYYTNILAWDDSYYSYAGIKSDISSGKIVSCPKKLADDFYFAIMDSITPTLTEVETIDNHDYGITMRMIDYGNTNTRQNTILGDSTTWEQHKTSPKSGILSTNLVADPNNPDKKYPTTSAPGHSLAELYEGATEVNHLFIHSTYEASGYFEFDSCQNFASLDGGNFRVYKEIGTMDVDNKPSLKHGQFMPYNDITPGKYASRNSLNLYDALQQELPEDDPRKGEKLYLVENPVYYNGLELSAGFVQTPNGHDAWGHDIIFEFTGDDDFWLYVDDELVLDLGGIHSALAGNVNFSNGKVKENGVDKTLKDIFYNNYIGRGHTAEEAEEYVSQIFKSKIIDGETCYVFQDYSSHTMKVFYMERGAGASNLHMRFNLNYVTPGSVMLSKEITGIENLEDELDFSLVEFPYQIYYRPSENAPFELLSNDNEHIYVKYQNSTQRVEYRDSYTPPKASQAIPSVYFLNPGKIAEIHFPDVNVYDYYIVECAVNTEVYDSVTVPGVDPDSITQNTIPGNTNRRSFTIPSAKASDRNMVTFQNHVNPEGVRTLQITKELVDEKNQELTEDDDSTTFSFRLYLTNGADDQLELTNMYRYRVRNPQNQLCRWEPSLSKFVSIGKEDYQDLSEDEKNSVTFETSMNGSISRIPAGYTVEVPGLPVGTLFQVVERDSEIPLGYKLKEYDRDASSYIDIHDGDTSNSGRIRPSESPSMTIVNQRGWEIQAEKVWSDKLYTTSHGNVYFALYVGDASNPVSVKEIKHPNTSTRFFIDSLENGKTISDYHINEVELEGVTYDSEGNISGYSSIRRLDDGGLISVNAVSKGSSEDKPFGYMVNYTEGQPQKTADSVAAEGNIRKDTVTNTRSGGIVMTLYQMGTDIPLAGGTFTLQRYDAETGKYVDEGTFISDRNGRITILYEHVIDAEYRLVQTAAPKGFIGLPELVSFVVNANNTISMITDEWKNVRYPSSSADKLIAYIDVYNKPYTIEVYKYDGSSTGAEGLKEAYFELYRGVAGGYGGIVKDYAVMAGYENLVTGDDGIITGINHELAPNTYFLTEKTPPAGYIGLKEDVVFEISPLGGMTLTSYPTDSEVELIETDEVDSYKYLLKIPNKKEDTEVKLTVSKTVAGAFGNKAKEFTFTFETEDGDPTRYSYTKKTSSGSLIMDQTIMNGENFMLGHNEEIVITMPADTEVTITESNTESDGYVTTVAVDAQTAENARSKHLKVSDDTTLSFVNTRDGAIPTGVSIPIGMLVLAGLIAFGGIFATIMRQKKMKEQL